MNEPNVSQVYPGVWKITLGQPEGMTPVGLFPHQPAEDRLAQLPSVDDCPIAPERILGETTGRGYQFSLPLGEREQVYGLGLQLLSFNQRGKKKMLRVNSDPVADTGDSHAPVPFYVTSDGYGVLIDSLRYLTVYCGSEARRLPTESVSAQTSGGTVSASGAEELYATRARSGGSEVIVEIPRAQGADVYVFGGPSMREAVQRYNLFSGGGCVPSLWGLGVWYRCKADFKTEGVLDFAKEFREAGIPCDVLGLEPGWQSHSYSCSHTWGPGFPDPAKMMDELSAMDFHINLWTHAFTHPSSPIHEALTPRSGDYLVWEGLVPDFSDPEARTIYADFVAKEHVDKGSSGYKLDECDNSDFIGFPWSFPEISRFPSGLDGEQMHSAFGTLYQHAVQSAFEKRDRRTYGEVRSAYALAASMPYVLYSDLYDHQSFIRGVVTSGFSGLLWCPEVRHAVSAEDLIRRIESVVFSPQALVNAWYIQNPPWQQWVTEANNAGVLHEERTWVTDICRRMFELRMQFLPYLYSAFMDYHLTGAPPFRAPVMDDPSDPNLWHLDTEYMMGDRVLVAPVIAGITSRDVYLPKGAWRDFWTGKRYEGGQSYHLDVPIDRILVFVKDDSILPLAQPTLHTGDPAIRQLTVHVYGSGEQGITLFEDDGTTFAYRSGAQNKLHLTWDHGVKTARSGDAQVPEYDVKDWVVHE